MKERLEDFADRAVDTIGDAHQKVHEIWGKANPKLYDKSDATYALSKIKDRPYSLGTDNINPADFLDQTKIWSLSPEVLGRVKHIVKDAGHVHYLPFIMGTYNMSSQKMAMNDVCVTDPFLAYQVATGGLEGVTLPFLRGLYYIGRDNWWRHESIHARHHHQMANYLEASDPKHGIKSRLEEAGYTIHEAGIEEMLTRFQALKEARGLKEKATASLTLLWYLEYSTFSGARNLFIDSKKKINEAFKDDKVKFAAKTAATLGLVFGPPKLNEHVHAMETAGEIISGILPVTTEQVKGLIIRGDTYVDIALLSALFSTRNKGVFEKKEKDGKELPTSEYKFPFVYSPVTALTRSVNLLQFLNNIWDSIPNYREVESSQDIDKLKKEIEGRVQKKLDDRQARFTMNVLEDALKPAEHSKYFSNGIYVKGMFIPAMYLRLRELYPSSSETSSTS